MKVRVARIGQVLLGALLILAEALLTVCAWPFYFLGALGGFIATAIAVGWDKGSDIITRD